MEISEKDFRDYRLACAKLLMAFGQNAMKDGLAAGLEKLIEENRQRRQCKDCARCFKHYEPSRGNFGCDSASLPMPDITLFKFPVVLDNSAAKDKIVLHPEVMMRIEEQAVLTKI